MRTCWKVLCVGLLLMLGGCRMMTTDVVITSLATAENPVVDGMTITVTTNNGPTVFEMDIAEDGVAEGNVPVYVWDWEDAETTHIGLSMAITTSIGRLGTGEVGLAGGRLGTPVHIVLGTCLWVEASTDSPAQFEIVNSEPVLVGSALQQRRGAAVPGMQQYTPGRGLGR